MTPNEKFEDIEENEGGIVLYKGKKLGIYKNENGEIFAVNPYCGHLRL
jgi:nitrite reductase/ring-hydroxylating ferredoxin subunit